MQGKGVDVILDCIGAPYLEKDLDCLAVDGCIVYIGFMGGVCSPGLTYNVPSGSTGEHLEVQVSFTRGNLVFLRTA